VETVWPGEPQRLWDSVEDRADLWVPGPEELPTWASSAELGRRYLVVPAWWQRALLLFLALFLAVVVYVTVGRHLSWESYGPVRRVLAVVLLVAVVGGLVAVVVRYVWNEVRWARSRSEVLAAISARLQGDRIPVWALLVGKIRLGDRSSGPNDTPDDIQFIFDLRVSRETLRRQRAVATAWVDTVAAAYATNVPKDLGTAFGGRACVHCADVFGEQMRGVWMWRKGSVLPYEVLGLALTDPRDAEELTDEDVVFTRRTSRELRRRSRIARR